MKLTIFLLMISVFAGTVCAETPEEIYAKGKVAYEHDNFVDALEYLVQYRTMRGDSLLKNPDGATSLAASIAVCKDRLRKLQDCESVKTKGVIIPP
jgi:hypothetical protein